jgi:diguanylate cyclase (GGDEF)-like protein
MKQRPGTVVIGIPIASRFTDLALVPIATRYERSDGTTGAILLRIRAKSLSAGYEHLDLNEKDFIALVGLDGIARAGSVGKHQIAGQTFPHPAILKRQKLEKRATFSYLPDEINRGHLVAYSTLSEYPLMVIFGAEMTAVLAELDRHKAYLETLGALGSLLILIFSGMLGVVIYRKDKTHEELRAKEAKLHALATRDHLTSLPNRAALETFLETELRRAEVIGYNVACLFIDIDELGEVNTRFGHTVGDKVLQQLAASFAGVVEDRGCVARIGGDEFVAIIRVQGDPEAEAVCVAEEIKQAISCVTEVEGHALAITASMGISLFPKDARASAELIRCADAAMAFSKIQKLSAPQVFDPEMHIAIAKRLALRSDLAHAIEAEQFEVFYQPKLDLLTHQPIGMEALVRWRHPVRGIVAPADFLQIAEESGLIGKIGALVIKRACQDCRRLIASGYTSFSVAVNVSAHQFWRTDLADTVRRTLRETHLPAGNLDLEVTESIVATNPEDVVTRLKALKKIGVTLTLDNFGTGYSNLQYLSHFPINTLNIDRSFVAGLPDDANAASIVQAIAGLARNLRMHVLAEGVETLAQQEALVEAGCDAAQGFLYARPMPFDEFRAWLRTKMEPDKVVAPFKPARLG